MMGFMRSHWIVVTGLFFIGLFSIARQSFAEPVTAGIKATPEQGLEMVRETSTLLFRTIEEEGLNTNPDKNRLYELVDELIFSKFDFARISSRVLGKNWRVATPEQKKQFIEQFKSYLLYTYATTLSEYRGQEIDYLPVRSKQQARAIKVQTRIRLTEAAPINVDYVLFLSRDGSWKVIDMLVEGISLVVTHRSSFQMEIRQKGLLGLIAELKRHNQENAELLNAAGSSADAPSQQEVNSASGDMDGIIQTVSQNPVQDKGSINYDQNEQHLPEGD
ncbi:MAG: ABC transporter substrate-binding protein [Gammaproteobacteria bacterium]|nr:ABC transporter substrate-binding protein [Gammaproteobacteria bacterium]NNJ84511.1 ABC transporter substrate-binding protein [Gammaproteobacteria bacterium]